MTIDLLNKSFFNKLLDCWFEAPGGGGLEATENQCFTLIDVLLLLAHEDIFCMQKYNI